MCVCCRLPESLLWQLQGALVCQPRSEQEGQGWQEEGASRFASPLSFEDQAMQVVQTTLYPSHHLSVIKLKCCILFSCFQPFSLLPGTQAVSFIPPIRFQQEPLRVYIFFRAKSVRKVPLTAGEA